MRERLVQMLEPAVSALGYDLVKLEYVGENGGKVLRLYIDRARRAARANGRADTSAATASGITVEDCARVSRQVSQVLDREDPIAENYTLEVSSPGEG